MEEVRRHVCLFLLRQRERLKLCCERAAVCPLASNFSLPQQHLLLHRRKKMEIADGQPYEVLFTDGQRTIVLSF